MPTKVWKLIQQTIAERVEKYPTREDYRTACGYTKGHGK